MSEPSLWLILAVVIGGLLALDLLVFQRNAHAVSLREAALWSFVWIGLGLGFGALVWAWRGPESGEAYLAGYAIEKALSMDNVFLFAMIFSYFAVPAQYQHRLLFWGVLGAIVFRAVFIVAGASLLEAFHWTIYIFGLVLLVTGWRMARAQGHGIDPQRNPVLRALRRLLPVSDTYSGQRFFVRHAGRLMATPLLAVLVVVETSDVLFAIDSIPAIFAITTNPFIVFSSNAFAILGLRSLYFLLAGMIDRFAYIKIGLSALLVFAGIKILISDLVKIPVGLSLGVIVAILGVTIAASLWKTRARRTEGV
ncbi:MAG: TerC family protein [Chloroflexota bacterium]|nr:TerC family protein [Chloroflexota bacterium]